MKCYPKTISDLKIMFKNKQIELSPPYQRKPVWKQKQRKLLLSSLFNGIPIPALIFHKHFQPKIAKDLYHVLDGKQRIETILHFIGEIDIEGQDALTVEFKNPKTNKYESLYFEDLSSKKINKTYENILEKFWQYPLPIIEYEGELTDIFGRNVASKEVFVRINSTGSPLKKNEIRHALWQTPFFDLGKSLETRYKSLFLRWKIISSTDINRYLFHEFILELCTACYLDDYSDRRRKLDALLSHHEWSVKEINQVKKKFNRILQWIKNIFPNETIKVTRFKNKSDFYSLFVVLSKLDSMRYITSDAKANKIAGKFMATFSKQIKLIDRKYGGNLIKEIKLSDREKDLAPYINSTMQATDSKKHREIRHQFLMSLLKDGFFKKTKDSKRYFDENVRDILWIDLNVKSDKPKCPNPNNNRKCKKYLTYDNSQVDHRSPWSKGGSSTNIGNAQLLCSSCNHSKSDN